MVWYFCGGGLVLLWNCVLWSICLFLDVLKGFSPFCSVVCYLNWVELWQSLVKCKVPECSLRVTGLPIHFFKVPCFSSAHCTNIYHGLITKFCLYTGNLETSRSWSKSGSYRAIISSPGTPTLIFPKLLSELTVCLVWNGNMHRIYLLLNDWSLEIGTIASLTRTMSVLTVVDSILKSK